jgi:RNA polymerase sigma-70 factor (ECF subfamily)
VTALRDPLLSCARLAEATESRAADHDAIAALYANHARSIHRFLCDLLGDATLAADATQETFVRAFRRIDTLRDSARVAPWLFGVARNVSFELRKARCRARRVFADEGDGANAASPRTSPEAELLGREAARVVSTALAQLSEDRRAVLLLRLDHGLAYDEIAELMGWSLAKVKVEIHRAREVLRATLAKYEEGGAR